MFYDDSWGGVFADADGVVFVADSQEAVRDRNAEFYRHLGTNLAKAGLPSDIPYALQANKRDLPNLISVEELSAQFGRGTAAIPSIALRGQGVIETLRALVERVAERKAVVVAIDWDAIVLAPRAMPERIAGVIAPAPKVRRGFFARLFASMRR